MTRTNALQHLRAHFDHPEVAGLLGEAADHPILMVVVEVGVVVAAAEAVLGMALPAPTMSANMSPATKWCWQSYPIPQLLSAGGTT